MEKWMIVLIPLILGFALASKFGIVKVAKEMVATALDMAEGYNQQYNVDDIQQTEKAD